MRLFDYKYGDLECIVVIMSSAVDSYIISACDWRGEDLCEESIDYLNCKYESDIQWYAHCNGSINHN
jgi:hypothetical protein